MDFKKYFSRFFKWKDSNEIKRKEIINLVGFQMYGPLGDYANCILEIDRDKNSRLCKELKSPLFYDDYGSRCFERAV